MLVTGAVLCPEAGLSHARLVGSEPPDGAILAETPDEIRLRFDEEISSRFSSAQLLDVQARRVEIRGLRADPADARVLILDPAPLPPGVYSVLARTLSEADGHFSGSFVVFGVGEEADLTSAPALAPPTAPPPFEVLLRWLNFSFLAALVGSVAILPLLGSLEASHPMAARALRAAQRRVVGWAIGCAAGAALVAGTGLLVWQTVSLLQTLPEGVSFANAVGQVVGATRWGALWLARELLLAASMGALASLRWSLRRGGAAPGTRRSRRLWLLSALLGLGVVAAQASSGHAASVRPHPGLAVATDALHLLAAAVWTGGVAGLAVALLPLARRDRGELGDLARAGWRRFGLFAAVSTGLVVATGLYAVGRQVASLDALLTTPYGNGLLAKVALFLAMGAVGLLNSMLLHPTVAAPLARMLARPAGWTPLPRRSLSRLVVAEAVLALLVLLATALVTSSPSPRGSEFVALPQELPHQLSQRADDVLVTLMVKPNRPGHNVFSVFAASTRRPPPAEISRVILRFTHLDQDLDRVSAVSEEVQPTRYLLGGSYLNLAGRWRIDVAVRRRGLEDSVASFDWFVAPPGPSRAVVVSKRPLRGPLTWAAAATLILVLSLVAFALRGRGRLDRWKGEGADANPRAFEVGEEGPAPRAAGRARAPGLWSGRPAALRLPDRPGRGARSAPRGAEPTDRPPDRC